MERIFVIKADQSNVLDSVTKLRGLDGIEFRGAYCEGDDFNYSQCQEFAVNGTLVKFEYIKEDETTVKIRGDLRVDAVCLRLEEILGFKLESEEA